MIVVAEFISSSEIRLDVTLDSFIEKANRIVFSPIIAGQLSRLKIVHYGNCLLVSVKCVTATCCSNLQNSGIHCAFKPNVYLELVLY